MVFEQIMHHLRTLFQTLVALKEPEIVKVLRFVRTKVVFIKI